MTWIDRGPSANRGWSHYHGNRFESCGKCSQGCDNWLMKAIVSIVYVISMVTLFAVILFNMYGKKIVGVIPILLGLIVGYIFSVVLGWLTGHEFCPISQRLRLLIGFQVPSFDIPFVDYGFKLYPSAILTMAPIAFVTMTEHFGHVMVLNSLTGA